jgi:hypothetical protein
LFTVTSFGYIDHAHNYPDWIYHHYDNLFSHDTKKSACSVEILAIETFSGRRVANLTAGNFLTVPVPGSDNDTITFPCMHHVSQTFVRIPRAMGNRVPHNSPFWCLAPNSEGDEQLRRRVERTCDSLRTSDLRLELFAKASDGTKPMINITTRFTTTMGSYPLASRPDLSNDVVIHAIMPYNRVDRFNKIIYHMWMSYHALMGFQVVSSITNMDFYSELPRHVANHPNIAHYDLSILKAVGMDVPSQYHLPYVVEFEKIMLATWVRFEYRVLYKSRFVVNADPDEFLMAPHGPGFDMFHFSPYKHYKQAAQECKVPYSAKLQPKALPQNEAVVRQYLDSIEKGAPTYITADPTAKHPVDHRGQTHFVPLKITDWIWTSSDLEGIKRQGRFIKWVINEIFALSVNPNSRRRNLRNFVGKGLEVVLHKEYVSTENTTTECVAEMLDNPRDDVYTFNKCFDYLSIMHPGTMRNAAVRSKYLNINQACVKDAIHHSCYDGLKGKSFPLSSPFGCSCYRAYHQQYLFLMHFRENKKSGGHDMFQIRCTVPDHEEMINSVFSNKTAPKLPYVFDKKLLK